MTAREELPMWWTQPPRLGITSYGSTVPQVPGRSPVWPGGWCMTHPLDPVVFGAVQRVKPWYEAT